MALKDAPATAESRGIELVGYHDLGKNPAFKVAMQRVGERYYLYLSHFWVSRWSVIDVTDPANPELISHVDGPPASWTYQVQVADGLMIGALERPTPGWGYDPAATEEVGVLLFDVKADPAHPSFIAHYDTGGRGTHRNYYDGGRYAYLATEADGFTGNILSIVDVSDPTHVVEVGRWWAPGQHLAAGETGGSKWGLHGPAHVVGDLAYCSWGQYGFLILDVSDKTQPTLVSRVSFGDFGSPLGVHTAFKHGDFVVVNSESLGEGDSEGLPYAVAVDVHDPAMPRIVSWFPTPIPEESTGLRSYQQKGGRHGPHNQHQYQGVAGTLEDSSRVYFTHFNAGLRVYDFTEPLRPREIAHYVPADPTERLGPKPAQLTTSFEDLIVDERGYIYCTDKNYGLFVLTLAD
ncbi:LVIVD repeat-containing protein [Gryllotalpicola reticulitermitis]|uniref:LVIVD repeat-containing protein n=1 Tax=Gryllotalpicola reticulitermitis TaxID=1184153 RepID=A0ABV8Q471_9MICO